MLNVLLEKLSKGKREGLADTDFAIPEERKFPIQSKRQAVIALNFASWPQNRKWKDRVVKKVISRYPELKGYGASKQKEYKQAA